MRTEMTTATGDDEFVLRLASFEGPLDLLLEMARRQKVDLMAVSILDLARQYSAFVESAHRLRIELRADYLVMAAWLALLKSRLLIRGEDDPEESDLAADLTTRLRHLDAMRDAAKALVDRPQLGQERFARGAPEAVTRIDRTRYAPTLLHLLQAYAALRAGEDFRPNRMRAQPSLSIDEAMTNLTRLLGAAVDWTELARFLPAEWRDEPMRLRSATASTFAACLELAKRGDVDLRQNNARAPLQLRRRS